MRNANDIRTRNRYQILVPENWYQNLVCVSCNLVPVFFLVSEKLVPDCMTHVPNYGTSFLVPESGTGFWYVCHWHKGRILHEDVNGGAKQT